jgi:hypothetical protein
MKLYDKDQFPGKIMHSEVIRADRANHDEGLEVAFLLVELEVMNC